MSTSGGLRVTKKSPQLLVEDQGRPGWAHLGVPASGALDRSSLALANRLVGNCEAAAGLEIAVGGCSFVAEQAMRIALTGAVLPLRVAGRPCGWGEAISVRAGQPIEVGTSPAGLRGWLAVAGGLACPPVLGSRSTDTLTGIGPAPVETGDTLEIGTAEKGVGHGNAVPDPYRPGPCRLRTRLGPRSDWFTADAVAALLSEEYVVSADSDRIGLRLQSASGVPLQRRTHDELPSEGVVLGAVQVPAGGQPLVFLADHPVTGGYPVIGVVDPVDVSRCAQLRPGDLVSFVDSSRRRA